MFPSEMVILMAIAGTRDLGSRLLTRPMDVTGEYIGYLYHSLVTRGYLKRGHPRCYHLTPKGKESLAEFLRGNRARVQHTVRTLQQLGIEVGTEIDKQKREAVEIK